MRHRHDQSPGYGLMTDIVQINDSDVRTFLLSVSPRRGAELAALLDSLAPNWLLDRESTDVLFESWLARRMRSALA